MDIKTDYRLPPTNIAGDAKALTQTGPNSVMLGASVSTSLQNDAAKLGKAAADTETDRDVLEATVSDLQDHTQSLQRTLNFSINEQTGRTVVEVTDMISGEVIRQLPTEEALRLAESIDEMRSLLFEAEA